MAKVGMECEGEVQGIETLFITADEWNRKYRYDSINQEQIYVSDHDNVLDLYDIKFKSLAQKHIITVERTKFDKAPYYVNIMLVIDNNSFWKLRGNDHIKFSKELNVYAIKKKTMIYTDPCQFASDVAVGETNNE